MGMSSDKRRILEKQIAELPYLAGISKEEADLATKYRNETLELIFDQFIRPDGADRNISTTGRWKRASQLWKSLLVERRASYFIDLKASHYIEWIKTGAPIVLPCTTEEVEDRNRNLPELQGSRGDVSLAKEIRATFMKYCDGFEQRLLVRGVIAEKRRKLEIFRDILRKVKEAEWFIMRQPKEFTQYENLSKKLVEK